MAGVWVPRSSKSVRNTALRSFRMPINLSKGVFVSPLKHGTQLRNPSNMPNDGFLFTSIASGKNVRYIQIGRDAAGTYWLYVVTDKTSKKVLSATGESVGIDFGMETYLTLNTGEKIHHPQPLKQSLNQLRKLNKAVSRKVKGSNNWWRAVRDLARLHIKIANQRLDWQWKLATDLCRRFDTIVTETL